MQPRGMINHKYNPHRAAYDDLLHINSSLLHYQTLSSASTINMAEPWSRIYSWHGATYIARLNSQKSANHDVDGGSQLPQQPQPQSWCRAILCNPIIYASIGFTFLLTFCILWCLSFIIYPIQLALGIRMYRNPKHKLKKWAERFLIIMLVLSLLELSLLAAQLWEAYRKSSVDVLHLSLFKWWQYSKNVLVLGVLIVEVLSPKFYTGYMDEWLERMHLPTWWTNEEDPLDVAEKGLLKEGVSPVEETEEKGERMAPNETAIVVVEGEKGLLKEDILLGEEVNEKRQGITPEVTPMLVKEMED